MGRKIGLAWIAGKVAVLPKLFKHEQGGRPTRSGHGLVDASKCIDHGWVGVHVAQLMYATFSATCSTLQTAKAHLVSAFLSGRALRITEVQEL